MLLATLEAAAVIADKGYDSDAILELVGSYGALAVIPPTRSRKVRRRYDKALYKERNHVERFFCRIKQYRGLATRYEKTAASYLAMLHLACLRLWLTPAGR